MASNISSDSLKNLCECPVCFEHYKDPRLLKCGHQFCENCLRDIAKNTPQTHIPCPVCREVTIPQHGDVTKLPRSTLHQYMQELIFRHPTEEALGQKCTKCKVNNPTRHCPECTADLAYLCEKCFDVHQKMKRLENHKTVQFDPLLICTDHTQKMVENFCYDCNAVACMDCMFDKHADHETEYLDAAAEKARKLLSDYITKLDGNIVDTNIIHHLKQASLRLEDNKKRFTSCVENIKLALKKFEAKLDQAVDKMNASVEKELQSNANNQTKIAEISAAQKRMLKLAKSLLGDVSDPQVIMGSRDLPEPDIDITEIEVDIPVTGEQYDKMAADIETMIKSVDVDCMKEIYKIQRRKDNIEWDLQHVRDVNIGNTVVGFSFIGDANEELLVRANDEANPIRVYNKDGGLIKQMGADVKELTGYYRQVSMDNHRDLYLITDNDGCLIRMESDGTIRDKTRFASNLAGVAYIAADDLYVLSENHENASRVFLVSPDTMTDVISLGDEGTFSSPYNVCVGDINGSTTIVVSDYGNDTLYLYRVSGELIRTYGPETHKLGRLNGIWQVSVDKTRGIVVCDCDNNRVLRVWSDKDGDHWECLLDEEQLGGQPWCVDIDNENRLMAVSVNETVKLYTF